MTGQALVAGWSCGKIATLHPSATPVMIISYVGPVR
jgi:hypothetical protein